MIEHIGCWHEYHKGKCVHCKKTLEEILKEDPK